MAIPCRRLLLVCALALAACSSGDADEVTERASTTTRDRETTATTEADGSSTTSSAGEGTSSTTTSAPAGTDGRTPVVGIEVVDTVPHRRSAFTQGLELHDGVLYESTGLVGESSIAALDPGTGDVRRRADTPGQVFAEGLTVVGDRLIQLTWKDHVAFVYDVRSFEIVGDFTYEGEGWGLCHDGDRLVMSDGSAELTFRDPGTFEELGSVSVELDGSPVDQLNELECVDDRVYANVWHTDTIMEIDPASGEVTTVIDASALRERLDPVPEDPQAVLNGIAHDADAGTFWLTGKLWPQLFEVRIER